MVKQTGTSRSLHFGFLGAAVFLSSLGNAAAGGGLVEPPVLLWSGASRAVAAADIDRDHDVDLVMSNGIDEVRVLENLGAGVFRVRDRFAAAGPRVLALGDLDGDRDPELVILDATAPWATVRENDGRGRFGAPVTYRSVWNPTDIAIVDLDGDRRPELVITGGLDMIVRQNAGDGSFDAFTPFDPRICRREAVVTLDADRDGDLDLAVSGGAGVFSFECCGGLRIVGNEAGVLASGALHFDASCHGSLAAGDVDADGDTDLVAAFNEGFLSGRAVLLNDGSGVFTTGWSVSDLEPVPGSLDLTDLDGDGDLDQVTGYNARLNDGAGSFDAVDLSLVALPWAYGGVGDQALADLDGDGDEDIVLAASGGLVLLRSLAADRP